MKAASGRGWGMSTLKTCNIPMLSRQASVLRELHEASRKVWLWYRTASMPLS